MERLATSQKTNANDHNLKLIHNLSFDQNYSQELKI